MHVHCDDENTLELLEPMVPARSRQAIGCVTEELYISTHMFHDHLPIRYVEGLLEALRILVTIFRSAEVHASSNPNR